MRKVLGEQFFNRPTLTVAKELLGKYIVRKVNGREICGMITETEAYDGFHDKASHASRGETERNKIMFGPAGYWYIYFTYGMHWILNIVTREKGYPAAVLIRGTDIVSGPARLTKYFKIDKKLNGVEASPFGGFSKLTVNKLRVNGLWVEDRGVKISQSHIKRAPRIGVSYASDWAKKRYRFYIK
ncbi:MAG: DNA-3-methyladenine glycosylase [Candidatus Jorgensenbacteria bacterium]|nr:DNA-3-methyladenine glycosylase [Candidatus Jorgensenbacteria bacterium]